MLDFNKEPLIVDAWSGHRVRLKVTLIPVSPEKPHGFDYSLILHVPDGQRIAGLATPILRAG